MRALVRFRWLVPAISLPLCVAIAGVGVQAAAFRRPPRETLVATAALHELVLYHVMRGKESVGRERLGTICVQGWYRPARHRQLVPGAIVLFSNGERLYDLGNGVRRIGRRGRVGTLDWTRFVLAACPRYIGRDISARLLGGTHMDSDPSYADGARTVAITFGERKRPIELYVDRRTYLPVELKLSGEGLRGWSDLQPGGGRSALIRVRRAFNLGTRPERRHA